MHVLYMLNNSLRISFIVQSALEKLQSSIVAGTRLALPWTPLPSTAAICQKSHTVSLCVASLYTEVTTDWTK